MIFARYFLLLQRFSFHAEYDPFILFSISWQLIEINFRFVENVNFFVIYITQVIDLKKLNSIKWIVQYPFKAAYSLLLNFGVSIDWADFTHFTHFASVFSRIWTKYGKIRTRKNFVLETSQAVLYTLNTIHYAAQYLQKFQIELILVISKLFYILLYFSHFPTAFFTIYNNLIITMPYWIFKR